MNIFLRSIGFKDYRNRKKMETLIEDIIKNPDEKSIAEDMQGNVVAELRKEYGNFIGIAVRGAYMDDGRFHMDYYYPYFNGSGITTDEPVEVERHPGSESYAGICDEMRIGVTLIFYLQNMVEYLKERYSKKEKRMQVNTTVSALSLEGKIVLPIYKNESQIKSGEQYKNNRNHLIAAAREGDEEAMESLTLEDIDTYSMVSKRVLTEDILSVVDTYFMPYGIESDQYSIMGEILDYFIVENRDTKEKCCILTLNSNNMIFDVCINQEDLIGEPAVGRRFKGTIWMQGQVHYSL